MKYLWNVCGYYDKSWAICPTGALSADLAAMRERIERIIAS